MSPRKYQPVASATGARTICGGGIAAGKSAAIAAVVEISAVAAPANANILVGPMTSSFRPAERRPTEIEPTKPRLQRTVKRDLTLTLNREYLRSLPPPRFE